MRRWVIGDIHGAHKALIQCFERSAFDPQNDLLICLGDLCDRWPEVNKVFDSMLTVQNLVLLLGNHDEWALDWFINGTDPDIWLTQGGDKTIESYKYGVPQQHVDLLKNAWLFYEMENKLFVHAGFNPQQDINKQERYTLLWDRNFLRTALHYNRDGEDHKLTSYDEVYLGHTPTINFGQSKPMKTCEVYLMDTGAGWRGGMLSMMDIDNKEYFQSDPVDQLYTVSDNRGTHS
jgi:serine/threonine protein phosphatase 1